MFVLTKKSRYKEFLRRAVKAVMQGGYLPPNVVKELSLNEDAEHVLATYTDAILLYLLNAVFVSNIGSRYRWADSAFVQEAIVDVCSEYDSALRLPVGRTTGHIFTYMSKISVMSEDERESGKQFQEAVKAVVEADSSAEADEVYTQLRSAAEAFFTDLERKIVEAQ